MTARPDNSTLDGRADVGAIAQALQSIRTDMTAAPAGSKALLDAVHENYRDSARNLIHYLALRRHDLRQLQLWLAQLGLSSLGRAESHVLATVDAVLSALYGLSGAAWPRPNDYAVVDFARGEELLAKHTETLLGPAATERGVRIMVTMPSEAADDYLLVHNLLQQGMDCMRINCAHDDPSVWLRIIGHLRRANAALGRQCKVVMDLAGPKLRTGPLAGGSGGGTDPSAARLVRTYQWPCSNLVDRRNLRRSCRRRPPPPACRYPRRGSTVCAAANASISRTRATQTRASTIVDVTSGGCWAEMTQSAYVTPGSTTAPAPIQPATRATRRSATCRAPKIRSCCCRVIG